jgi:histone H3/H4
MKKESNLLIKITGYELSGELILPKSKAERLVKKIVDERRKPRTEIKGMLTFEFTRL